MTLTIRFYGCNPEFIPNYYDVHYHKIKGSNAAECMASYNAWRQDHDLAKYTCSEIYYVED